METKSIAALGDHLGYWLRLVSNHVSGAFAEKLAARDISVAEWVLLRELYDAAQPPSLLATLLGQRKIGNPGMLAAETPFGLAVSEQINFRH